MKAILLSLSLLGAGPLLAQTAKVNWSERLGGGGVATARLKKKGWGRCSCFGMSNALSRQSVNNVLS